ncbi:MAG: DUF695 domain-containing protein [Mariniblastus sp.]|nr:DUF695 domain-containing protein [Mariniblastus sp.]
MKLEIDDEVVSADVTAAQLADLDLSQPISLIDTETRFLQWWTEESGDACINFRGSAEQQPMIAKLGNGFEPERIAGLFKCFHANDDRWSKEFEWVSHSELDAEISQGEWQASVILVGGKTPATVLCNVGLSDFIDDLPVTQFVLFVLTLQTPDENGLATDEESEFCDAIETEIALFTDQHAGVSTGEITLAGVRRFYTYNEASELDLQLFLERVTNEFDCELSCQTEEDPDRERYWGDLFPEDDELVEESDPSLD